MSNSRWQISAGYAMKRDDTNSTESRLIFRERYHPLLGFAVVLVGLAIIVCASFKLVPRWPFDLERGVVQTIGFVIGASGVTLLRGRQIVLDRQRREIVRTSGWAFMRRSTTEPIGEMKSVTWSPAANDGSFEVHYSTNNQKILLFEVTSAGRAREITGQIAHFFAVEQQSWEQELLAAKSERMANRALTRGVASLLRGASLWRIARTETRFTYYKTSDVFCKVFAIIAGPMGIGAILVSLFGNVQGDKEALPLVGAIFLVISIVLFFARWGFTVDTRGAYASKWWGLWFPFYNNSRELPRFSAVAFERAADTVNGQPVVIGRVVLVGDATDSFMLWKSTDEAEAKWLAGQLADFLKFPVIERTSLAPVDAAM